MASALPPGLEHQLSFNKPALTGFGSEFDRLYHTWHRQYLQTAASALADGGNPLLQHLYDQSYAKVDLGEDLESSSAASSELPMKLQRMVPMKLTLPAADGIHDTHAKPVEIGDTLKAACAAAFEFVPTQLSLSAPADGNSLAAGTSKGTSLGRWVVANGVTTLQCHGLDRNAALEDLVLALNAEGLAGCYNFVSTPRRLHGDGLGYAFINFTSPESAALLVEKWQGVPCPHACLGRRVRFSSAEKQGYHKHVSTRGLRKFDRIRKTSLWPLVMSEDGRDVVFGSDEAIAAALSRPSPQVGSQ